MQRPLVYYSNIRAALRVLTGAKDIELNPGPLHMSTHEILTPSPKPFVKN